MIPLAHIGGIPVEEWLPFVVPVVAVYLYVRRRERRRRADVQRLLAAGKRLDDGAIAAVLERLRSARYAQLNREHVALLYPPGPDGATAREVAGRVELDPADADAPLEDLIELGYLERTEASDGDEARLWLTAEGFAVTHIVEDVVLARFAADGDNASSRASVRPTHAA